MQALRWLEQAFEAWVTPFVRQNTFEVTAPPPSHTHNVMPEKSSTNPVKFARCFTITAINIRPAVCLFGRGAPAIFEPRSPKGNRWVSIYIAVSAFFFNMNIVVTPHRTNIFFPLHEAWITWKPKIESQGFKSTWICSQKVGDMNSWNEAFFARSSC
jgi:hypothetical protein